MEQTPFQWCFIGCGTLAKKVARQLVRSGRHKIAAVYARNNDKCAAFAAKYGAVPCRSAEEAIAVSGVQGVYVVTPHTSHHRYAKLALTMGKPVLCEKPMTVNAAETAELIRLAREKHLYLAEAMWTWFAPVANQIDAWLKDGSFGELKRFYLNCHVDARGYAPRVTDPNAAGGALLDMGVYPLTYMVRLFGKPDRVTCRGVVDRGIDWEEDVTFHYQSGFSCSTSISIRDLWGLERLVIEGTDARVSVLNFHNPNHVTLRRRHGPSIRFHGDGSYLNEFDLVAAEILQGLTESRYVPLQTTLDVMQIMDDCRRQLGLVYPFEQ